MTEDQLEMLRAAVNMARFESIRTVAMLRARLQRLFPGREDDINEALLAWSNYEANRP